MKINIASSSEDSSILISYIIDIERYSNFSLNFFASLVHIPCFRFVIRMLYMLKGVIAKSTMSD